MENLINIAINLGVAFFILVINPEFKKAAAVVRGAVKEAIKFVLKKRFEVFIVVSLSIILVGVIKIAFLAA